MKKFANVLVMLVMVALFTAVNVFGEAAIYESFADGDPTLIGNATGEGLDGTWRSFLQGGGTRIVATNLTYGKLLTQNDYASFANGAWYNNDATVSNTTAYADLLVDGGEMWFSMLYVVTNGLNNTRFYLGLGTSVFTSNSNLNDPNGQAVGVSIGREKVWAGLWATNAGGNSVAPPTAVNGATDYGQLTLNETSLIVGHAQWGATTNDTDTVTLYMPDANLTLGSAVAQSSGIVNQASFSLLATAHGNNFDSIWDEIRFGPTYASVTPQPPPRGSVIVVK